MSQAGILDAALSNGQIATQFDGDQGSAIPIANVLTIEGNTVANATYAEPLRSVASGNTVELNIQVAAALTGAPGDKNDAGIASFDDAFFSVDADGYVSLIGSIGGVQTNAGDDSIAISPDGAGQFNWIGNVVSNATNAKPVFVKDSSTANALDIDVQLGAAITGAPADSNDAGIVSFDDTSFAVDANGYVTLIASGSGVLTQAGDDAVAVSPDGAGQFNWIGNTVANATHAKPLYVKDSATANSLDIDIQVATERTGAPVDSNDAGIVSFDDTQFVVDANGYVTMVGGSGLPAIQTLTSDDPTIVGPDASGNIDVTGEAVANATNAKPVFVDAGTNALNVEVQVGAAITGAPLDSNDAGIVSFDDTDFSVDANGYVQLSGTGAGQTITGDSGGALSPTAGNWNILGSGETSTSGSGSTLSILSPRVAQWVVDPTANNGTHTTIASAISAASSGDTIVIRSNGSTYTEDITLKDGVTLVGLGWGGSGQQPSITGKITLGTATTVSVSGIQLLTNSDYCIEDTGSTAGSIYFTNCHIQFSSDAINLNNANRGLIFENCTFNRAVNSTKFLTITACSALIINASRGSGLSFTPVASTIAAGDLAIVNSSMSPLGMIVTSGTASMSVRNSSFGFNSSGITYFVCGGSGAHRITNCQIDTGTTAAISVSAGTTLTAANVGITSSNANPVTGAGTINYGGFDFSSTGHGINTTTQSGQEHVYDLIIQNKTNYAVVCGPTGDNEPLQFVSGVGTSGQVLTSNGASALPTFQDASGGTVPPKEYWFAAESLQPLETNFAALEKITGATNTINVFVRAFDDTTEEYANGKIQVPGDVDTSGTVTFRAYVMAKTAAASKNIALTFGHIALNDSEDFDGTYTEEDSGDKAISATQDDVTEVTWTETITNMGWAANDLVLFRISRDPAATSDLTGDMYLFSFAIEIPRS